LKYIVFALLAAALSAEKKEETAPALTDQERAGLYYLLWQQEAAEARLAAAQMATREACAAVPACAKAQTAERAAEADAESQRQTVAVAFKPLNKEGWDLTQQLTYRKKEPTPPAPAQAKK
jgi:hypothetical protein